MGSNPYDAYKSTQIKTASKEQILLMLYEGAIKFMKQGQQALKKGENELAHQKLLKSQDIVTELMASLDMDIGGDIAEELYSLYDYTLHNLVQANVEKNPNRVRNALNVMEDLNDAWNTIINEQEMTFEKAQKEHKQKNKETLKQDNKSAPSTNNNSSSNSSSSSSKQSSPSSTGGVTYGDLSIQG